MDKEKILKDFLKLKKEGLIEENFSSFDELVQVLSDMFEDMYSKYSDAQEAYCDLDDDLDNCLSKNGAVYCLGTKEWEVKIDNIDEKAKEQLYKNWNDYYNSEINDIDDLVSAISHRIMKDMSNAGCDVHNALAMIINDVFGECNCIYVDIGEESPRIEFLF